MPLSGLRGFGSLAPSCRPPRERAPGLAPIAATALTSTAPPPQPGRVRRPRHRRRPLRQQHPRKHRRARPDRPRPAGRRGGQVHACVLSAARELPNPVSRLTLRPVETAVQRRCSVIRRTARASHGGQLRPSYGGRQEYGARLWDDDAMAGLPDRSTSRWALGPAPPGRLACRSCGRSGRTASALFERATDAGRAAP